MTTNINLKITRQLRGLTQLQLANAIGVKEMRITKIETGRTPPTEKETEAIMMNIKSDSMPAVVSVAVPKSAPKSIQLDLFSSQCNLQLKELKHESDKINYRHFKSNSANRS